MCAVYDRANKENMPRLDQIVVEQQPLEPVAAGFRRSAAP